MTQSRHEERTSVNRVELVTIFRDKLDLPYEETLARREELASIHTIFSVVALVRDISQEGLGIKFEGQQIMARNILQPGEKYIVKLTLLLATVEPELAPFIKREGNYHQLLLKMACRWHDVSGNVSTAGFELLPVNPTEILDFVRDHFGLGAESEGRATPQ